MAKSKENFTLREAARLVKSVEPRNRVYYQYFLRNKSYGEIEVAISYLVQEDEFKTNLRDKFKDLGWEFGFDRPKTRAYVKKNGAEFVIIFRSSWTKDWAKNLESLNLPREMMAIEMLETRFDSSSKTIRRSHSLDKKR